VTDTADLGTGEERVAGPRTSEPPLRPAPFSAPTAAVAAIILPGLGHFVLGRRGRALVFFVLVAVSVLAGVLLTGRLDSPTPGKPLTLLATFASMGMGAPYLVLRLVGYVGDVTSAGFEYGTAFLRCAGVMNLLLVLDAWDIATGRKE